MVDCVEVAQAAARWWSTKVQGNWRDYYGAAWIGASEAMNRMPGKSPRNHFQYCFGGAIHAVRRQHMEDLGWRLVRPDRKRQWVNNGVEYPGMWELGKVLAPDPPEKTDVSDLKYVPGDTEVPQLLGRGLKPIQMARCLSVKPRKIHSHLERIIHQANKLRVVPGSLKGGLD